MMKFTKNEIYSVGDRSRELLKEVDTPVTITFPVKRTAAEKDAKNSYILKCAEEYEKNFGNISLKFFDLYSDVASANEYKKKPSKYSQHYNTSLILWISSSYFAASSFLFSIASHRAT